MSDDTKTVEQTPAEERKAAEAAFAATVDEAPAKAAKAAKEKPEAKASEAEAKEIEEAALAKAAKEKEAAAVADPWDGVPVVVRTTLKDITDKLGAFDALKNEIKTATGRLVVVQRELAAAKSAAAKASKDAPTPAEIEAAAKTVAGWEDLKEFNPGWAAAIDARIAAERAELLKQAQPVAVDVDGIKRDVSAGFDAALAKANTAAVRMARELVRVDDKYPNWETDIRVVAPDGAVTYTPEFAAWEKTQAPEIRALAESEHAFDAIKMLDLYYDHRKGDAERLKKLQRLETAIPAKGTPGQREPTITEREDAERAFASV